MEHYNNPMDPISPSQPPLHVVHRIAPHLLDIDPAFEPQLRSRSNTWPLPRPDTYTESAEECNNDTKSKASSTLNDASGLAGQATSAKSPMEPAHVSITLL